MDRMWDRLAFATHYGHQPLSEVRTMPRRELDAYVDALSRLLERENGAGGED